MSEIENKHLSQWKGSEVDDTVDFVKNLAVYSTPTAGEDLHMAGYTVVVCTAAEYAAITTKDSNTLYFVTA